MISFQLDIQDIKYFWGVSQGGKSVKTACYLWVQSKTIDYRSVATYKKNRCKKDAEYLNEKFRFRRNKI